MKTFVYLPQSRRYVNLANVVEVRENYGTLVIRTIAPAGAQHYEGQPFSPDHYTIEALADSADGLALTDALAELLVEPDCEVGP